MKLFNYLFIACISFSANSQPLKVIHLEKEWTDSTTVHSFFVFTPGIDSNQKISLKITFKSGTEDRLLTISETPNVFQFQIQKNKEDSILRISLPEYGDNKYKLDYSFRFLKRLDDIIVSPLMSLKKLNDPHISMIPSNNFAPDLDTLCYEFYSQFKRKTNSDKYGYNFSIVNSNTDTLLFFHKKIKENSYTYNRGNIPISKLLPGKYKMNIDVTRNNSIVAKAESNEFYVLAGAKNRKEEVKRNSSLRSEYEILFAGYSIEEFDDLFLKAQYISSKKEKELYESLKDVQSKKAFMTSFWENRKNNDTENFDAFTMRISTVNSKFGNNSTPGYKTDKGRVYLKYGECEDIYISNMSSESKPYEVWYYSNIQNGIYFFFVDLNGYGDFKLIHSTALNEVYNLSQLYNLGIDKDNYRK